MYIEKESVSKKSATVTAMLCLFFGSLGLHHFYVGKYKRGLLYLLFGSSSLGIQISKGLGNVFFDEIRGTLIGIFLLLLVAVGIFYDLFALYTESFLDSNGLILLSGSRKDELFGRTLEEKFNDSTSIEITVFMFIAYAILYFLYFKYIV